MIVTLTCKETSWTFELLECVELRKVKRCSVDEICGIEAV